MFLLYFFFFFYFFIISYDKMCILCGVQTDSIAVHLIMYCRNNCAVRSRLWKTLYMYLGQQNYDQFIALTPREPCIEMFAFLPSFNLPETIRKDCFAQIIILLDKLGNSLRLPYKRGSGNTTVARSCLYHTLRQYCRLFCYMLQ